MLVPMSRVPTIIPFVVGVAASAGLRVLGSGFPFGASASWRSSLRLCLYRGTSRAIPFVIQRLER